MSTSDCVAQGWLYFACLSHLEVRRVRNVHVHLGLNVVCSTIQKIDAAATGCERLGIPDKILPGVGCVVVRSPGCQLLIC